MGRIAVRLAAVVAASCSIGLGSNLTTYSAEDNLGVYVSGFGAERSSDGVYALWLCADEVPSRVKLLAGWQRCPGEELPTVRAASKPVTSPQWQRLDLRDMVWLAMNVDADRDWSKCRAYFTDVMNVSCADGFEVKA